jgi:peptidoglycan-associated lipoprotein
MPKEMSKMMRTTLVALMVAVAAVSLGACGKKAQKTEAPEASASQPGADSSGVGQATASGEDGEVPGPQEGLLAKRTVYFDFDSSEIRGEGTEIVAAHAKHLARTPGIKVRLEGHTDERGSREYNIGLGERRAQAVRRALLLQGAADTQLSTVGYGEERPAAAGTDESAWTKNRRVEIVYLQ